MQISCKILTRTSLVQRGLVIKLNEVSSILVRNSFSILHIRIYISIRVPMCTIYVFIFIGFHVVETQNVDRL